MWLSNSSVGRKVVMSVTGIALSKLVCISGYRRTGCSFRNSHYLRILADNAESQSAW